MDNDLPTIEIRLLAAEDSPHLRRLSELDTAEPPPHPVLGGIVGGRLVAAHSLTTNQSIADPFRRTAELRSLLALRASELRGGRSERGPLGRVRQRLRDLRGRPIAPARAR